MPTVTIIKPTIETGSDRKIRAAAYCRVSSNSDDQINSYMAQMTYYTHKFENSETETLVDLYADEGISGTREDKRPEFQRLIKDCRKGKIDRIYTKSISRFARNTRDCLKNVRELKSLGISIFFEKENIDTANIADEMMITIMGGLAQEESVSISQNMQWSVQRRMKNGTFSPPSLPYGYRRINGKIEIYDDEAEIVQYIFESYLNGIGMELIAKNLNNKVEKNSKGFIWCKNTVRYILTNEKYTGTAVFQKYYTLNSFPFKQKDNKGERDKYIVENAIPVIIPEKVFNAVQELNEKRQKNMCHIKGGTYPLSGTIKCDICGSRYRRKIINGQVNWICSRHILKADYCNSKAIHESYIYSKFIAMHNRILANYREILVPMQTALNDLKVKKFKGNANVINIHNETAMLREQIHVIAGLRTKGFLSEEKYQEQTAELNRKISKLQKELKMLTKSDDEDETLEQIDMLVEYFESREKLMIEFEEKTFEFLVDRIIANQNELEFHLPGGLKFTEKI